MSKNGYRIEFCGKSLVINDTQGLKDVIDKCKTLVDQGVKTDEETAGILAQLENIVDWEGIYE